MKTVTRAVVLAVSAVSALSSALAPLPAGADAPYSTLRHPQQVRDSGKREVVEVFWYGCLHSQLLEQPLEEWAARQPADVVLHRIPAVWAGSPEQDEQRAHARLYFTLDKLGQVDRLQQAVFRAVRQDGLDLTTEQAAADWAQGQQVDRQKFVTAYESDEVRREVDQAPDDRVRYEVNELPTAVVQGQWATSPTKAGGVEQIPAVLDQLLAQVRAAKH
ncbi:thiol:disulfide interchange protein DsbA/DsbL [Kitasatospora sp. NPDC058965]|uniref:thiol:disulfide interchange protein DsbA/DsbL n=1 Tax=Kitasatospora sp. NPDC058965 TaxID=3346682 RepID=UPI0036A9D965